MDCQMPVLDGYEATRKIRAMEVSDTNRRVPIIAMTASAIEEERRRCLEAGMDDFISKPFRAKDLKEKIDKWAPETTGTALTVSASLSSQPARPLHQIPQVSQ
jgi:CheY-like chemotaxis protein